jgi:protein SCO1/2
MLNRLLIVVAIGLACGAAAAVLLLAPTTFDRGPAEPEVTGKALIGGPFSLVDQSGTRVTEKDFAGRAMLVFFGYTHCPDLCPSGLQVIAAALDKLGPKADRVTPIFITVDPERDTPQVMAEYVKSFHPRLVGLTGSPAEIAAVTKAYRVYAVKVADGGEPTSYSVDHSAFLYLMDATGAYVAHFPSTVSVEKLTHELDRLL